MSATADTVRIRRVRACDQYEGFAGRESLCSACKCRKWMHKPTVTCSQCGGQFPGVDSGYSHCYQHAGKR